MKHEWHFLGRVSGTFVVVLIVTAVVLPFCLKQSTICTRDTAEMNVRSIAMASSKFYAEFHDWPDSISEFTNNAAGLAFILWGPLGPLDPWGNAFTYVQYSDSNGFGLAISWGADGEPGGTGMDRDRVARFSKRR